MRLRKTVVFAALATTVSAIGSCTPYQRLSAAVEACENIAPSPERIEDAGPFVYDNTGSRPLFVHVLRPEPVEGPAPAVLFFFGGGWRVGQMTQFLDQARAFRDAGYVAILADYRVHCRDDTGPVEATENAHAAYAWLRAHQHDLGIDPARIVLSGSSAGGQLALNAALAGDPTPPAPAALVLFNPAVDLTDFRTRFATGLTREAARPISPVFFDLATLPPTVIFHGQDDRIVPIGTVRAFCARASEAGRVCEIHEFAGQGHGLINNRETDTAIGTSPFAATLAGALAFLADIGITR